VKELDILLRNFQSSAFGEDATLNIRSHQGAAALNSRNAGERAKALSKGAVVAGKFNVVFTAKPAPDDGISAILPSGFASAGLSDIRILQCSDREAEKSCEETLRECDQKLLKGINPVVKNIDGKGAGQFLRLLGMTRLANQAAEDVESILKDKEPQGVDEFKEFFFKVARKDREERAVKDANKSAPGNFGSGTWLQCRIPESSIMGLSIDDVRKGQHVFQYFRDCSYNLLTNRKETQPPAPSQQMVIAGGESIENPSTTSRINDLFKQILTTTFETAFIHVVTDFRVRTSKKGQNEMQLLASIQSLGVVGLTAHLHNFAHVFVVQKRDVSKASAVEKNEFVGLLSEFGVDLD
jgi:hypothetical protein